MQAAARDMPFMQDAGGNTARYVTEVDCGSRLKWSEVAPVQKWAEAGLVGSTETPLRSTSSASKIRAVCSGQNFDKMGLSCRAGVAAAAINLPLIRRVSRARKGPSA